MDRSHIKDIASRSKQALRASSPLFGLEQWRVAATLASQLGTNAQTTRPFGRTGPRVLVADDNHDLQYTVGEMLACMGAHVLLAEDGAQAVSLVRCNTVDLVLMDLQMPVLDGLGATLQIRRDEIDDQRARVPVVAFSSSSPGSGLLRKCGFDGALDKPCTEEALRECICRWCEARVVELLRPANA
jgi:two-component system sensor histidine kinase/response regulator